jgi:hypothetical protein
MIAQKNEARESQELKFGLQIHKNDRLSKIIGS